ncbi:MAG: GntP family permease [Bacteroidia bacterium]
MDPIFIVLTGIAVTLFCIIVLRLHALVSLLFAALVTGLITTPAQIYDYAIHNGLSGAASQTLSQKLIGTRLADAFGNTVGKIGILIALASIIGTALMKSGGAERIIRSLLTLTGKKNTSLAFLTGSFTLGIPVFFDTVFYLMIPLVKSISVRNPKKFSLYLMSVMAGGVMAHSLVPPTPGPLFVAKELGVDIGVMMIGGIVVGAFTVICGYLYALWANRKWELPMRDTPDISIRELKENAEVNAQDLPTLWLSLLPVLLPVLLITGKTFLEMMVDPKDPATSEVQQNLLAACKLFGDSNIALFISAIVAMYLLWSKTKAVKPFEKHITESLYSAGMIILITAAGGTFGQMLQQTGIGVRIADFASGFQTAILPLAFFITLVIRTAQGSATVAMVTAIGIMSGFQGAEGLGFHPVYLALVIGCGSKIFPWMNDSGFWIVTKMSGMEEKESIRFFSYLLTVMGFSGLIITMILSLIFPFA